MISAQVSSHPVFKLPFLQCCHEYAKSVYSSIIIIYTKKYGTKVYVIRRVFFVIVGLG